MLRLCLSLICVAFPLGPLFAAGPNWQKAAKEAGVLIAKSRRLGGEVHARKAREILEPWWDLEGVPQKIRLQRAMLLQRDHHFEEALADLNQVLVHDPKVTEAWLMKTTILCVSGRYDEARKSAVPLFALATPLLAVTAGTAPTSCNGSLAESYQVLNRTVKDHPGEDQGVICWAHTALAEMAVKMGKKMVADEHFRTALFLDPSSPYLLKNYANFLIDAGDPSKAASLLREWRDYFPVVWMRARKALDADQKEMHLLMAKYEENLRSKSDEHGHSHGRDEAVYFLEIKGDVREAIHQFSANWESQREAADLLIFLKAAIAAGDEVGLANIRKWVAERSFEDVRVQELLKTAG